jgi:hypothetical protein
MDWMKKGLVTFSLAFSKVEKDALAQNESEEVLRGNVKIINPYVSNHLMQDLKNGNLTREVKEFRKRHYQILKESAKYKFKNGQLLTEEETANMKITKGDPHDNYPVEVVFDNKAIGVGLLDEQVVRPLKIKRGVIPRHKLENYTSVVHIRDIDGKNKLIDFYIPIKPGNESIIREIEVIKKNPKVTDLVNFLNMSFTTQDSEMLVFEYKMLAFDKISLYNNNYIVKMFAEVVEDGRWLPEKYMIID